MNLILLCHPQVSDVFLDSGWTPTDPFFAICWVRFTARRPMVQIFCSASRQQCAGKSTTLIAAVLKLLTLQSTLRPSRRIAASAGPPSQHSPFRFRKSNLPVTTAKWGRLYRVCHDKLEGHLHWEPPPLAVRPPSHRYLESLPWRWSPSGQPDERMPSHP